MKRKKLLFPAFFICLSCFTQAGCGRIMPETGRDIRAGGTVTVGIASSLADSGVFPGRFEAEFIVPAVYETLVQLKPGIDMPQPLLAGSWEISGNNLVYTFTLEKGIKFHDGSEFDSAAAAGSLERLKYNDKEIMLPDGSRVIIESNIDEIRSEGTHTLVVTLKQEDPYFLFALAGVSAAITGKSLPVNAGAGGNSRIYPAGTGPFFLSEIRYPDEKNTGFDEGSVFIDRFKSYHGRRPYLERVVLRFIPDQTAAYLAFRSGDVDMLKIGDKITRDKIKKSSDDNKTKISSGFGGEILYVLFNPGKGILSLKEGRLALSYLINRDNFAARMSDRQQLGAVSAPYAYRFTAPGTDRLPYDPAKAAILLSGEGKGGETALTVITAGGVEEDGAGASAAEVLDKYLAVAGIRAFDYFKKDGSGGERENSQKNELPEENRRSFSGADIFTGVWFEAGFNPFFAGNAIFGTGPEKFETVSENGDKKVFSALIYEAVSAGDHEAAGSFCSQAADFIADIVPWIAAGFSSVDYACSNDVMGVTHLPAGSIDFSGLWVKKKL